MPWKFTDDVHVFAEHTWEFLASRPVENTVALTMIENLRAGLRYSDQPPLLGWHRGGATSAAMSLTLPYELVLAAMSDGAMDELVSALRARRSRLPGVTAGAATAERFATAWTTGGPARVTTITQHRLYAVDALRPPTPQPPGRPRQAGGSDIDVAARWLAAFQEETGSHVVDARPVVRDRIENALLWLWEDDAEPPYRWPAGTGLRLELARRPGIHASGASSARLRCVRHCCLHRRRSRPWRTARCVVHRPRQPDV